MSRAATGCDPRGPAHGHRPGHRGRWSTRFAPAPTVFKALVKGASGYLTKNSNTEKIIDAIQEVVDGGAPMTMNIAKIVIKSFHKNQKRYVSPPFGKRNCPRFSLIMTELLLFLLFYFCSYLLKCFLYLILKSVSIKPLFRPSLALTESPLHWQLEDLWDLE